MGIALAAFTAVVLSGAGCAGDPTRKAPGGGGAAGSGGSSAGRGGEAGDDGSGGTRSGTGGGGTAGSSAGTGGSETAGAGGDGGAGAGGDGGAGAGGDGDAGAGGDGGTGDSMPTFTPVTLNGTPLAVDGTQKVTKMPEMFGSSVGVTDPIYAIGPWFLTLETGELLNDFASTGNGGRGVVGGNFMVEGVLESYVYNYTGTGRSMNQVREADPLFPEYERLFGLGITLISPQNINWTDAVNIQDPNDPGITLGILWTNNSGGAVSLQPGPNFGGVTVASVGGGTLTSPPVSADAFFAGDTLIVVVVTELGGIFLATQDDQGMFDVEPYSADGDLMDGAREVRCEPETGLCATSDYDGDQALVIDATSASPSLVAQADAPGALGVAIERLQGEGGEDRLVGVFAASESNEVVVVTKNLDDPPSAPTEKRIDTSGICDTPAFLWASIHNSHITAQQLAVILTCESGNTIGTLREMGLY